jgi:DNA-binding beta-propeller fold protein YncE
MLKLLALTPLVLGLLVPSSVAATSARRPVALVTAETANEVFAVSLGPHGGHVLRHIHLAGPLMITAPQHGPAVVVSTTGTVTLLAWHALRPIKVFHSFRSPKVAAVAPDGRLAYVTDERTGDLSVIDLARRKIVGRVFVGLGAHHLGISPDGRRIWVALGETATTIVRLNASNPRKPRVVGRLHPRYVAHDLSFEPDGRMVWVSSASSSVVALDSADSGRIIEGADGGRAPQHVAFSGGKALITSGYGSSLTAVCWLDPCRRRVVSVPYGSFNLATYGGYVVTTSLFTGQVTELRVGDLHRLWTTKVAPAARYVAISVWPR